MARTRKKTAEAPTDGQLADQAADAHYAAVAEAQAEPSFDPAELDALPTATDIVQSVADSTRIDPDAYTPPATATGGPGTVRENGFADQHRSQAHNHLANPSSKRRESHAASVARRLPSTLGVAAGDLIVKLVDKGDNLAGIGIRVEMPKDRTLTEAEKDIVRRHVKGEDGEQTGFSWNPDFKMWHKPIVRPGEHPSDVPSSRPIAIRLDAEARVERLAESLRHHSTDPVSYAQMVAQQRENAANADRVPD